MELNLCGQEPYSEGSPQSIWLWFPDPRGLRQETAAGIWFYLLLQLLLFLRSAHAAKSSSFKPYGLNLEPVLCSNFLLQSLEHGGRKLHNLSALEAGQMQMVLLGLDLVIVLFAVEMHQVQFVDHSQFLE